MKKVQLFVKVSDFESKAVEQSYCFQEGFSAVVFYKELENIETENFTSRFFIDKRVGCIAVRDRKHPQHNPDYQGLHHNTADVIFYAHGNPTEKGWDVDEIFIEKAKSVLEHLQSLEKSQILI